MSASPVRAVVFDFGGVLGISPMTFISKLAEVAASTPALMVDAVFGSHVDESDNPWHAAERGELALRSDAFAHAMSRRFAARGAQYDHDWFVAWIESSRVEPDASMVALVADVRSTGRAVGLLTNSVPEFRPVIERTVDVGAFDAVVDSCTVGVRKPAAAIYTLTAERLGQPPGACLLLDDLPANVAGAEAAGMIGWHVTDTAETAQAVREFLAL